MAKRPKLPSNVERGIQILSGFKCCLCGTHGIQIHHIDGDRTNNDPANLAALCLPHHDEAEQGKATDGHRLSIKLTAKTILSAKQCAEDAQARRLGFASTDAYWRSETEHQTTAPALEPKYHGIAFQDWKTWEVMRSDLAAFAGEESGGYCYFAPIGHLDNRVFAMVRPAIPGEDVKPPTNWIPKDNAFIIPLLDTVRNNVALTTFDYLAKDKQLRITKTVADMLRRRDVYERVGLLMEFRLNGHQPWPEGHVELELGVWLQHVAILRHYFNLLGDGAKDFERTADEGARLRASNVAPKEWSISLWDAFLSERARLISTIIRGKAQKLAECLSEPLKSKFNVDLATLVEKLTNPLPLDIELIDLAKTVATAISAIVRPEKLNDALNYPNPVLHQYSFTIYKNGIFPGESNVVTAMLTNTGFHYMEPAETPGHCNMRLTFHNDYQIEVYPNCRIEPEPFKKSIFDLGLKGIFEAVRKRTLGSLIVATPI